MTVTNQNMYAEELLVSAKNSGWLMIGNSQKIKTQIQSIATTQIQIEIVSCWKISAEEAIC